jgi:hypothetical protein
MYQPAISFSGPKARVKIASVIFSCAISNLSNSAFVGYDPGFVIVKSAANERGPPPIAAPTVVMSVGRRGLLIHSRQDRSVGKRCDPGSW